METENVSGIIKFVKHLFGNLLTEGIRDRYNGLNLSPTLGLNYVRLKNLDLDEFSCIE